MPDEAISICGKIVDPVVVMPDTDSKTESVRLRFNSLNKKGSAPKMPIRNQAPLVNKKACRNPRSSVSRRFVASHTETPKKAVKSAESAKTCHSPEPVYKSTHMGINMAAASTVVSKPKIFMTGDSCILVILTFYVDVARCDATF